MSIRRIFGAGRIQCPCLINYFPISTERSPGSLRLDAFPISNGTYVLNLPELFEPPIYIGGFFIGGWGGCCGGVAEGAYPRGLSGSLSGGPGFSGRSGSMSGCMDGGVFGRSGVVLGASGDLGIVFGASGDLLGVRGVLG
jgi:hypothetical protein